MHVDRLVVIRRLRPGLCDCFSHMSTNKSSHCVLLVTRFCRNPLELRVFQGSVSLTEFLCGEGRESACVHAVSPSFNSNTNTPVYGGGGKGKGTGQLPLSPLTAPMHCYGTVRFIIYDTDVRERKSGETGSLKIAIFCYPSAFKPPDGGVPWDDLCIIFRGCQWMAKVPNGEEKLRKISTGWVWRTNVTDRQTTDRQTEWR